MDCEELEIVQYKFASIIGGLCGKPKILSQFAVWLDLRLAEYKLKGAISLDCSGSTPDPDWLQGIKPDPSQQTQTFLSEHVSAEKTGETVLFEDAIHHSPGESTVQSDLTKTDPYVGDSAVFPVQQYENVNVGIPGGNNLESTPIKYRQSSEHFNPSPSKMRKVSSTAAREEFSSVDAIPGNQSFTSEPEEVTIDDDDNETSETFSASRSSDFSQAPSTSAAVPGAMPLSSEERCYNTTRDAEAHPSAMLAHTNTNPYSEHMRHPDNIERRNRLANQFDLPKKTLRNISAAVGSFERWLWRQPYDDKRRIEEIPPSQLDVYLTEYFTVIKKPTGDDYTHASFHSLRTSLDRYLKEMGYSESITMSLLFSNSIAAFRKRRKTLILEQYGTSR